MPAPTGSPLLLQVPQAGATLIEYRNTLEAARSDLQNVRRATVHHQRRPRPRSIGVHAS